jgi:tRNA modification GTPase
LAQGGPEASKEIKTIVAPATPAGESAVAVVRLSGPDAVRIARQLTGADLEPRRASAVLAGDEDGPIDRVVATWFQAPKSYTGEDLVELSCHGSPYVRARLIDACVKAGARPAAPGEFTLRAFLNGRLDLAQAEAVAGLIRARSARAHRAALAALEGGLSRRVAELRARVVSLSARTEASIDHPDEDVPLLDPAEAATEAAGIEAALRSWLERSPAASGDDALRVCIVGAPNVGKSSLLNALLGRDRAIVLDEPGTTRDVLEERIEFSGAPALLVDTAGLRGNGAGAAEALGIDRTRRAIDAADLCLLTFDSSRPPGEDDRRAAEAVAAAGKDRILVLNKRDLPRADGQPDGLAVSARTGDGLDDLCAAIRRRAADSPDDEAAAATTRQRDALAASAGALILAAKVWSETGADELAAAHLRDALDALDRVTGGRAGDDVLNEIFSRFCIGK